MDLKELESGVDPRTNWYYQSKKVPLFKYFENVVKKAGKKLTVIENFKPLGKLMIRFCQLLLFTVSVLISSTSCSSYPYSDDNDNLGFGPVKCPIDGGPCTCSQKFKAPSDRYDIHEYKERDRFGEYGER